MLKLIQKISNAISRVLPFPGGHPWDYVKHIVLSFAGTLFFFAIFTKLNIAPVVCLISSPLLMFTIGTIKEIIDKLLEREDVLYDTLSNAGGVLAAIPVMFIVIN